VSALHYHRRGSGEPLVLIHGIGSRWQMWLPVLDRLAQQRTVIALDLPGFGLSPMPQPPRPAGAGSLAVLVAEFLATEGIEAPHVAGNSLGGWIALELARRGLARSVTALSPAGFYSWAEAGFLFASLWVSRRAARQLRPQVGRVVASPLRRRLLTAQLVARGDRLNQFEAAENVRGLADAPWFDETLAAICRERFPAGGELPVPVTIAWGEHDRLLLRRQAARAAQALPGASVLTLTGCGHVPTYDDPGQVARVLLEGSRD
jgi:pimeloyl-ACP methyl ester carboxylesterase